MIHALLTGHDGLLGDPVTAWRALAADPGGAEAASAFLGYLALFTGMRPVDRTALDTEQVWWTAALHAGMPPGALAGTGHFAAALPDAVWLPLARRSAAHSPAQTDAIRVAERAAAHPREPEAPPAADRPAEVKAGDPGPHPRCRHPPPRHGVPKSPGCRSGQSGRPAPPGARAAAPAARPRPRPGPTAVKLAVRPAQ